MVYKNMSKKFELFEERLKPRNIVEAYVLAVRSAEMNPSERLKSFQNVISFCEQDHICSKEDSIKRNTLLFWAYDKVAQVKLHHQEYKEAMQAWLKSFSIGVSPQARLRLGAKMLQLADEAKFNVSDKAKNLSAIARHMKQAYLETGQVEEAAKMERLQEVSSFVLHKTDIKN